MKARVIALKKEERKALEAIVDHLKAGEIMMIKGAKITEEYHKKLWDILKGFYPGDKHEASFNYENYELVI